jgi:hypothetical protein
MAQANSLQTLKASSMSRVDSFQPRRLYDQSRSLGEGLICPAGAGDIYQDIYGRIVNQNTLNVNDAACSNYTFASVDRYIGFENIARPNIPIAAAGLRGGDDCMNVGRGLMPRNVYDSRSNRGGWIKEWPTPSNLPRDKMCQPCMYERRKVPKFDFSHDASTSDVVFRG